MIKIKQGCISSVPEFRMISCFTNDIDIKIRHRSMYFVILLNKEYSIFIWFDECEEALSRLKSSLRVELDQNEAQVINTMQ